MARMARLPGSRSGHNLDGTYAAAEQFVDRALRSDDSLFTPGQSIWSTENLDDLQRRFVLQPDESSDPFDVKFRRQLEGAPAPTVLSAHRH